MKEPQSVTRLYFSCLRVFHGVAPSEGKGKGGGHRHFVDTAKKEGSMVLKGTTVGEFTDTTHIKNLHQGGF